MPRFSECCRQGENGEMPVDMFMCQVCGTDSCGGCQYGDRIELVNITGYKGKGNVCKACLAKIPTAQVVEDGITRNVDVVGRVARRHPNYCHLCKKPWRMCKGHGRLDLEKGEVIGVAKLRPQPYSETLAIMELGKLDYDRTFGKTEEPLNPLDYADDPAELELQTELRNQGIMNDPEPVCCPTCSGELEASKGMVGERVMVCAVHGLVWEDHEDAIRRVI